MIELKKACRKSL